MNRPKIKAFVKKYGFEHTERYIQALETYSHYLENKETAKKPHLEGDGYSDGELVYDTWICPNCEESYEVDYEKYDYCPKCGQKIDWSEDE